MNPLLASAHVRKGAAAAFAVVLVVFSGCASPRRVALAAEYRPQINSTTTIAGLGKREISAEINRSNTAAGLGAAGGLIGSLVGSAIDASVNTSRAKQAEGAIAGLRNSLLTFDVPAVLSESLKKEISKAAWLNSQTIEVRELGDITALPKMVASSSSDLVLLIEASYSLTPSFDAITVTARVSLHPTREPLLKSAVSKERLPKLIYLNRLSSTWGADGIYSNTNALVDTAAAWAAHDGKRAREAMTNAMAELARMIVYDLDQPSRQNNGLYKAERKEPVRTVVSVPDMPMVQGVRGYIETRFADRDWVRLPGGDLCALP
jgi:hypothetical protein